MGWFLFTVLVLVIAWFVYKWVNGYSPEVKNTIGSQSSSKPNKAGSGNVVLDSMEFLNAAWDNPSIEKPKWFNDEATEAQLDKLEGLGVQMEIELSKGQVSDIIGLFYSPEDEDLAFIKFCDSSLKPKTQTHARYMVAQLSSDAETVKRYESRPLTPLQKAHLRWFGFKVSADMGQNDYLKIIHSDQLDFDENENPYEYANMLKWDVIESFMDDQSDRDFRESYDMKKIPITKVVSLMKKIEKPPVGCDSFEDLDPDTLAELLLQAYPEYKKG